MVFSDSGRVKGKGRSGISAACKTSDLQGPLEQIDVTILFPKENSNSADGNN